jgi:hypothetical protein
VDLLEGGAEGVSGGESSVSIHTHVGAWGADLAAAEYVESFQGIVDFALENQSLLTRIVKEDWAEALMERRLETYQMTTGEAPGPIAGNNPCFLGIVAEDNRAESPAWTQAARPSRPALY